MPRGHLEGHRKLIDAVLDLPKDYREVIVRRYFESLGHAEIARLLGISPELVRTRLRHALGLLQRHLGEEH